jgi:hypothetical protein
MKSLTEFAIRVVKLLGFKSWKVLGWSDLINWIVLKEIGRRRSNFMKW